MHAYPCMQNNEETFAKYAVDANLFQLGYTNTKRKYPGRRCFLVGGKTSHQKKKSIFSYKNV